MKVSLHNKELWEKFKEHQTEMNVTKEGRRMCPMISLTFEDLKPTKVYAVMIDFVFADEFKYCFDSTSNCWVPWGAVQEEIIPKMYLHPATPTTGAVLMRDVLAFRRLKLTNSSKTAWNSNQMILIYTMRRYLPRIHVIESGDGTSFDFKLRTEFCFPETDFIAVSAYRNKQITKLKIDANPFASAFRSNGLHGQAKRRRMEFKSALKSLKSALKGDSALEENFNNDDDPDNESTSSSSIKILNVPGPGGLVQSYDKQELDGIRAAIPFLKDRLRRDVSYFVYSPMYNRDPSQEKALKTTQVMEDERTEQMLDCNEGEAQLTCEESTEWMWGFEEQMSVRYSPERPELEAFLPKKVANAKNGGEANSELTQGRNFGDVKSNKHGTSAVVKRVVSRRKKYLPRKLQRTDDITPTDISCTANEEPQADVPPSIQGNVLSPQLQEIDCNKADKKKQLHNLEADTSMDSSEVTSPPVEAANPRSSQGMTTLQNENLLLSRTGATKGLSVSIEDVQGLSLRESEETRDNVSCSSRHEKTLESSLTALIQMCSEAGGSLGDKSSLPESQRSVDISSFCQVSLPQESKTATPPSSCISLSSGIQTSKGSSYSVGVNLATLASESEERTIPLHTPMFSPSSEDLTTGTMRNTASPVMTISPAVFSVSSELLTRSESFGRGSTVNALPLATVADGNTWLGYPPSVDSSSGRVYSSEIPGASAVGKQHAEYRPILPAPHPLGGSGPTFVCPDSRYCYDNGSHPIIIDSFSLNDADARYSFAQPPQVNQSYHTTPQSYQTGLPSRTSFNPLNNNVIKQGLHLERFYSFPAPNKDENQIAHSRLQGGRHYKTTRTNFSRLSLEPLCSVVYPLTSFSRQITNQRNLQSLSDDKTFSQGTSEWGAG